MDGFNSHFFKASWDILKDDMHAAIMDFLELGKSLKKLMLHPSLLFPN